MSTLQVDELELELRTSPRRKTLQLTIDRGGELVLSAPSDASDAVLSDFVREKKFWLYTKLAEKELRSQPVTAREFVNGEGFRYLGRSYRLLIVEGQSAPLKLQAGRFRLDAAAVADARRHFVTWYSEHALAWLTRRCAEWAPRLGAAPTSVSVRDLGYRWGSCSPSGSMNFHWSVILLPAGIADYVVVHELAHRLEPLHDRAFWALVERVMPDFESRKAWLARSGGALATL